MNAILAALRSSGMVPGDVLLIEVETVVDNPIKGYPVEIDDHWFDAIRLAAGNGIVVIEPAGNGDFDVNNDRIGRDLDQLEVDWPDAPAWRSLNRKSSPLFLDSGAIVVSACTPEVTFTGTVPTHRRMEWATYGSRIDCFAWGDKVYSCGYGWITGANAANENKWYTDHFNGTSAASAIIAGAALLVQQMHSDTYGRRLSPAQLRALFSDQALGTRVLDDVGPTVLGVMPDLGLVAAELAIVPDVFIRDSIADSGAVPASIVEQSPDIIIRQFQVTNPVAHFGDNGPWASAMPPNDPVVAGQPNYVYLRLRNRGSVNAVNTSVELYWSEASALVAPVHWHPAVKASNFTVPSGGGLTVIGPIGWIPAAGQLPASGHGCFVAVVDHPLDPKPPLIPGTSTWDDFLTYLGRNNNVAWRNFVVLNPTTTTAGLGAASLFVIRGAGDGEPREFALEIIQRVAEGVRITWEVPEELADMISCAGCRDLKEMERTRSGTIRLLLRWQRLIRIPALILEQASGYPCTLQVDLPRFPTPGYDQIVLRQLWGQREVGRLTWMIAGEETDRR